MMVFKTFIKLIIFLSLVSCEDFNKFYNQKTISNTKVPGKYIARVGNKYIQSDELISAINELPFKQKILVQTSQTSLNHFLESYINRELLYNKALELEIDKRDSVNKQVEAYFKKLLISNLTEELINHEISEEELTTYYNNNISNYASIKALHITLYHAGIGQNINLEKLIDTLRKKLSDGESLDGIDMFLNNIPTLNYKIKESVTITKYSYNSHVTDILFKLKPNEISDPIHLNNSYNIYKITEGPHPVPYINVKNQIKQDLRNKMYKNYLSRLRQSQGVEIYTDNIKEIYKHD